MSLSLLLGALLIFLLRIADVSIGTLRIIMLVRGRRLIVGALSFVESLIWLTAAAQVLSNLDSPLKIVAYAGGYAAGTMLGASIERWMAMGKSLVRVIAPVNSPEISEALRKEGFFVTTVNAEGRDGDVHVSFSVIPRKHTTKVLNIIETVNSKAFVTLEEVTQASLAVTPVVKEQRWRQLIRA